VRSRVYSVMMPMLERDHRFAELQAVCADMQQCYGSIVACNKCVCASWAGVMLPLWGWAIELTDRDLLFEC
jgi:hypothetical protein